LIAWHQHLELLSMTGSREAFAGLLERARPYIGEKGHSQWIQSLRGDRHTDEEDLHAVAAPFDRHHQRMAAVQKFADLFSGRRDCFARQWVDRKAGKQGYVPERRPMTPTNVEEHLSGRKTYGIYLMNAQGLIQTAVIDADLKKELRGQTFDTRTRQRIRRETAHLVSRIKELSEAAGAYPLVEFSGAKGYHFWFFFDVPVQPGPVRIALSRLVQLVEPDLTAFNLEVFPKQDRPGGKGFGNLVKLPLGLHRLTGKRSYFPDCANRSVDAQLGFLPAVKHSDHRKMIACLAEKPAGEVVMHPRWKHWAQAYPELYRLQSACAPLAQVMSLCLDSGRISLREEKILYQTLGFLSDGRKLLHYLIGKLPEYNPHQVDYRLSRLRGTPLGCRRIHSLLGYAGPVCRFTCKAGYLHPLLHIEGWQEPARARAKKSDDLSSALKELQTAILQVERFME
jgi:hypothetical protein